jgi:hypothetical protein
MVSLHKSSVSCMENRTGQNTRQRLVKLGHELGWVMV